ncbi:MAG: monofunctional biosynthetic peptidoglycan transglycosylase [Desulfobacteraceae bacterium]|nr:monofunctional biosynthetic peptidoglycan transglycosylase [Desulfobacteraceae bacterium]
MSRHKKRKPIRGKIGRVWRLSLKFLFFIIILSISQVLFLRFVNPPFTARTGWTWFEKKLTTGHDKSPLYRWRQLKHISPHLRKAVLAGEDQRFLSHHGFDFIEMNEAFWDILAERGTRGASTITMQAARTVFLWPGRSWLRKMAEAYYTLLIEVFWSKERIFEIYLNTVDWGEGIMGAEVASRNYFRRSSSRITATEAALLAAVLPNPRKWSPVNPSGYVEERKRKIMRDMRKMPLL